MKATFWFLITAFLLLGCDKDKVNGNIRHRVQYTTAKTDLKTAAITPDSRYTQFGDYITSVTPYKFTSRIIIMCYQNNWDVYDKSTHPGGKTIEMVSEISFDTENLIQIYAGQDNIPYTSDGIFLFAPNYWERLIVKLEVN